MTKRGLLLLISILTVSIVQASMRLSAPLSYANVYSQLRGSFVLTEIPKTVTFKLAINCPYRLFVNNHLFAINNQTNNYQTNSYDVKSVLTKGKNVIAVEVINSLQNNLSFFFESKVEMLKPLNNSSNWKYLKVDPFLQTEKLMSFDANNIQSNWTSQKFDDSNWQIFDYKSVNTKVKESVLPNFNIKSTSIGKIAENSDARKANLKSGKEIKGKIAANTTIRILINNERAIAGFPEFKLTGGKDACFQFYYIEPTCLETHHLSNIPTDLISDKYISNGAENQYFIAFQRRYFKQLVVEITTQSQPVEIEKLTFIPYSYPIDELAYIKTDNEQFNKAWQEWIKLQYLFTTNSFIENPYLNTISDSKNTVNQSINLLSLSGDERLLKQIIQQNEVKILSKSNIDYNDLQFVALINQYFHYQVDTFFLHRFLPIIIKIVDFHKAQLDTLLYVFRPEFLPSVFKDKEVQQSLQFCLILDETAKLLDQYHYNSKVAEYKELSVNIKRAVMQHFSVNGSAFYYDGISKLSASQYTASLALLAGIVRSDERATVAQQIITDSTLVAAKGIELITLYRAIHESRDKSFILSSLKKQEDDLLNVFYVKQPTDISFYFGVNAIENIVGFQALSDGFNQFVIEPNIPTFNKLNVRVLCSAGAIYIDLKKNIRKNRLKGKINLPKGTKGIFIWNGKRYQLVEADNEIECKLSE